MGLVVDASTHGQQIGEVSPSHEVLARIAEPRQERRVDLHDAPVGEGRHVAAGGVLVQAFRAFLEALPEGCAARFVVRVCARQVASRGPVLGMGRGRHPIRDTNSAMAAAVSSGRTELWAVARRIQRHEFAAGDGRMDESAHFRRCDGVARALRDERGHRDRRKIVAVVRQEGHACEDAGDIGVGAAEADRSVRRRVPGAPGSP